MLGIWPELKQFYWKQLWFLTNPRKSGQNWNGFPESLIGFAESWNGFAETLNGFAETLNDFAETIATLARTETGFRKV